MPELTKHGADVGSLKKQPLHDALLFSDGIAAQLAGLLGQVRNIVQLSISSTCSPSGPLGSLSVGILPLGLRRR